MVVRQGPLDIATQLNTLEKRLISGFTLTASGVNRVHRIRNTKRFVSDLVLVLQTGRRGVVVAVDRVAFALRVSGSSSQFLNLPIKKNGVLGGFFQCGQHWGFIGINPANYVGKVFALTDSGRGSKLSHCP